MIEPGDHTAWVDRFGDTWVRADDMPGRHGSWWLLTNGPHWEERARGGLGSAREWVDAEDYGPFTPVGAEQTERALERVRREVAS